MSDEPDNLALQLLRGIRGDVADVKVDVRALDAKLEDTKAELKADIHTLRTDVASDMLRIEKDTRDQIVGLRRAVIEYHSSVVGHGLIISELEARMRRVEQHLNLPSMDSH
jgi:hypothetical protein